MNGDATTGRGPLIHIGYHKTASSLLQRELFIPPNGYCQLAPPAVWLSDVLDIPAHSTRPAKLRHQYQSRMNKARKSGLVPVVSHERLSGSPHMGGQDAGLLAERLHQIFPEANVLIVVREQRAIIRSIYGQFLRDGGVSTLSKYLTPPLRGFDRKPYFVWDFLAYDRAVEHYFDLFGRKSTDVIPYELLSARPEQFLSRINSFAGVTSKHPTLRLPKRNEGLPPISWPIIRQVNRFINRDGLRIETPFEAPGLVWLFQKLLSFAALGCPNVIQNSYARFVERTIEIQMGLRYVSHNRRLEKIAGLNLRQFGYMI